jgi:hypothetical protein
MPFATLFRLLTLIAITVPVTGLSAAQALTLAGPNRPVTVPTDYIITPFGYFHSSCVMHLAKGDVVRQDEKVIQHADGTSGNVQLCAYPHFDANGAMVPADKQAVKPPTINGWVESVSATTSSSYAYLTADWAVPLAPTANDGQTIFIFPGLEDINNTKTILQPVLGWNSDFASAWGIASWNCCVNGNADESSPVRVNSEDIIRGTISSTCSSGTLSCPTWNVVTVDLTLNVSTGLVNSSFGQTFNWAFAGALEVYNVVQCADYPFSGETDFYNLGLYDYTFQLITNPGWSINAAGAKTPQCSYSESLQQQVNIIY